MALKKIEWEIALKDAGVSKTVKGIDRELAVMQKSFEDLNRIKAFTQSQKELKDLEAALVSARSKATTLAKEAEAGGKRQQNAYNKAVAAVNTLEQAVRKQTGAVAKQSAEIKKAGGTTRNLAQTQKDLSAAFKASAVDAKKAGQASASSATIGIKLNRQYREEIAAQRKARRELAASGKASAADLARADKAVADNIARIKREMLGLPPATKKAEVGLSSLSSQLSSLAKTYLGFQTLKKGLIISAGYGDELAAIEALTGATTEQMERLRAKTYELSGAAGGPTAVASAMAELANAGVGVNDILFGTENVRDMVTASRGLLTFGQAGAEITDILNVLGLTMKDSKMVTDQLVDGWSSASQTAPELLLGLKDVLGIYKAFYGQLSNEEVLAKAIAGLSSLADLGYKGSKGGRMLKNAFIRLVKPAGAAEAIMSQLADDEKELVGTGTAVLEKHKELIKVYDETGRLRDFADIIDDIGKAALSEKESLQLFGAIAGPALFAQVNKGGESIRKLEKDVIDSGNTARDTSEIMQSKLGGAFRLTAAEAEKAAIILTGPLDKALNVGIKSTIGFLKENKELSAVLGTVVGSFALFATGAAAVAGAAALAGTAIGGAVIAAAGFAAIPAIMAGSAAAVALAARSYMDMREAQKEAALAAGRAADQEEKYHDRLRRAAIESGLEDKNATERRFKSYKDLQAAYKAGLLDYDALTDTYSKGSGVARKAADVQVKAADDVSKAAAGTAEAVKDSVKVQEITLKEAQKEWDSYAQKIREIDQQIADIGNYGGGGTLQGLQQINGEWQFFTTNAQKAASAMQDFQYSALGTGEVADSIFELSLAGKSDIEVWNARKQAAEQYAQAAKQLTADAKIFAAAGDLDTANQKFAQAAAVAKKSESAYKALATTVKAEWTPAMEAAHKAAEAGVKKYEQAANKALTEAAKHYDKAKSAAQQLADRQLDLEARMLQIQAAGQAPAQAYATMAEQARKYEAAARAALKAGDFETAIAMADRATSAWDSLGNEVKDGEQTVVSAQQALADQAAGVQSAGQVAIDALKAQEAAELKAAKAAEEKAKKATAAKEAEAAKVKALEAEKEKVIVSAEEGAQEAAAGTINANQQLVEILEAQKTAIGEVADALNKQAEWQLGDTFTDAGEAAKILGDQVGKTADEMIKAMDAFQRSGEASVDALEKRLDAMVAEKRVVIVEVKEVSASASGSITGAARAATGNIFVGRSWTNVKSGRINPGAPSMIDSIPVLTAPGEPIIKASSFAHLGRNLFRPLNRGDEVGVAKQLVKNHPHVREVFSPQIRVTPAINVSPPPARQSSGGGQLPGNLIQITVNDYVDGVSYDKFMTPGSWDLEQAREQRRQNIKKVTQR
jgi:TP901 family phage tail tape measure protein